MKEVGIKNFLAYSQLTDAVVGITSALIIDK
jgi:hypothetical protein